MACRHLWSNRIKISYTPTLWTVLNGVSFKPECSATQERGRQGFLVRFLWYWIFRKQFGVMQQGVFVTHFSIILYISEHVSKRRMFAHYDYHSISVATYIAFTKWSGHLKCVNPKLYFGSVVLALSEDWMIQNPPPPPMQGSGNRVNAYID